MYGFVERMCSSLCNNPVHPSANGPLRNPAHIVGPAAQPNVFKQTCHHTW